MFVFIANYLLFKSIDASSAAPQKTKAQLKAERRAIQVGGFYQSVL